MTRVRFAARHMARLLVVAVFLPYGAVATAQEGVSLDVRLREGVWTASNAGLRDLDMTTLAVDPANELRVYAAGEGLIYRSLDGGESWELMYRVAQQGRTAPDEIERELDPGDIDELTDEQIEAVDERFQQLETELLLELIDEVGEDLALEIVEASRDDLLEQAVLEVLEESDEAAAEQLAPLAEPSTLGENRFTHLVVHPGEPRRIYAASGRGVVSSGDYGASFEELFRGIGDDERRVNAIAIAGDTLVLATGAGVQRASAGDPRFVGVPGTPATASVRFVAAAPSDPDRLYAVAEGRIYRSDDNGATWIPEAVPLGLASGEFSNLVVDPADPDHVWVGTVNGLLESIDGGVSFQPTGTIGLRERRVTWVAIAEDRILLGTPDGFYVSRDGGQSWEEHSEGLTAAVIRQVVVTPAGRIWLATGTGLFQLLGREELERTDVVARDARQRWADEPNLGETVQAALAFYGYAELPVESWAWRVAWRQFLPRATVRYTDLRSRDDTRTFIPGPGGDPRLESADFQTEADEEWRIYLQWDVLGVIYDADQITQRDTTDRLTRRRRDLIRRVVRVFDSRRTLLLRMIGSRRAGVSRQVADRLRLEELTARLDMFTDGFFTRYSSGEF